MARLNDPPPSLETLEALKRRFTRQNRDLARTNSAQSLRIRNLETEISRLLTENISLRETAIAGQKEAERRKVQHGLGEDVKVMKERLETKLKEVTILVEELGGLPDKAARREQRRKSTHGILGEARSPSEKDWRNRQTLAGVLSGAAEQEGRLPPIVEDKLYPRRTLEPLEIKDLVDADDGKESESPDLGPPPVAHFDVADPIDFDKSPLEFGNGEDKVAQHVNLETRRRRRTSSLLRDMTDSDAVEEATEKSSLFKSGAKRKLDMSELEDNAAPATSGSENEEFVFQRRPALKPASSRNNSRFSRSNQAEIIIPNHASSPQKEKERKALAPKSTNSPSKRAVLVEDSKSNQPMRTDIVRRTMRATEPTNSAERPPSRKSASTTNTSLPPSSTDLPRETHHPPPNHETTMEIPPKTPFLPTSILSPPSTSTSSEPVTSAPSTSSRPSEFAIINSVEDVLNGSIGRGSRRARAAVSYAEPNLRDKMRRPGGKVGAVEGVDGRRKRDDSLGEGEGTRRGVSEMPGGGDGDAGDRVRVKRHEGVEEERERWKGLPMVQVSREREEPGSPLGDKKAPPISGRFNDNGLERDRANALKRHAQARQAQKARLEENEERELKEAVEKLSIFDGPASSPGAAAATGTTDTEMSRTRKGDAREKEQPHASTTIEPGRRKMNVGAIGREAGRRHSTMPASASANVPQRPSSAASHRADRNQNLADKMDNGGNNGLGGLKRSTSMAVLKNQSHRSADVGAGVGTEIGSVTVTGTADLERSRSERMASRRRSMMV